MADMIGLNQVEAESGPPVDSTNHPRAEGTTTEPQIMAETADMITSSNPTQVTVIGGDDIKAKLEYALEIRNQYKQAVEKSKIFLAALRQRLNDVNAVTEQKLTQEINTLKECSSEREDSIQASENSVVCKDTVSLPVFAGSFDYLETNLKLLTNKFEVIFRAESIQRGPFLSVTKYHEIKLGFGVRGLTHDSTRQRFLVRTTDANYPLKLYDYIGNRVAQIGQEFPELADTGVYRGLCFDTKRDVILAASSGRALMLGIDGTFKGEIKVGDNLVAATYSKELDLYALSEWNENKVYIVDATSLRVVRSFGSRGSRDEQLDGPFSLCFGSVGGSNQVYLIVGDFNNHSLKLFDANGRHYKTLSSGHGELLGPSALDLDPGGRVVTCDLNQQRLLAFWSDETGSQCQELLTPLAVDFRQPAMVSIDTAARMMAIGYTGYDAIHIYKG